MIILWKEVIEEPDFNGKMSPEFLLIGYLVLIIYLLGINWLKDEKCGGAKLSV